MLPKPSYVQQTNRAVDFRYDDTDSKKIADGVHEFMKDRGYRLESGNRTLGIYGRGSSFWSITLGSAAVPRYSFLVRVTRTEDGKHALVHVENGMLSGIDAAVPNPRMDREYEKIVGEMTKGWDF